MDAAYEGTGAGGVACSTDAGAGDGAGVSTFADVTGRENNVVRGGSGTLTVDAPADGATEPASFGCDEDVDGIDAMTTFSAGAGSAGPGLSEVATGNLGSKRGRPGNGDVSALRDGTTVPKLFCSASACGNVGSAFALPMNVDGGDAPGGAAYELVVG